LTCLISVARVDMGHDVGEPEYRWRHLHERFREPVALNSRLLLGAANSGPGWSTSWIKRVSLRRNFYAHHRARAYTCVILSIGKTKCSFPHPASCSSFFLCASLPISQSLGFGRRTWCLPWRRSSSTLGV